MFSEAGTFLGSHYDVIDKKSGQRISLVQWADDKMGIYEKLICDENGELKERYDNINKKWVLDTEFIKAEIELVGKNIFFKLLKKASS